MLARYLPITAFTSAFFQRASTRHSFHSTRQQFTAWAVAWDLDNTLISFNSFYYLGEHVRDRFASIDFIREKLQKIKLGERLKAHPRTANLMKEISAAGGKNCIVTANPYSNFPTVVLECMGFSQEEILDIPFFGSIPRGNKNDELRNALTRFGITEKCNLAFVDDNDYYTACARYEGFPSFHPDNIWSEQSELLKFVEKMKKMNQDHNNQLQDKGVYRVRP